MPGLTEKVREAGVIGAGGAGFPTDVKIAGKVKTLIINGAECELLLTVDSCLLLNEQIKLLQGLNALVDHLTPENSYLCIKAKNRSQINQWSSLLAKSAVEVFPLDDFYPAGDEHVLVYEVTGQVIPSGGIPLDVSTVVVNVETLLNIGMAAEGYPVTTKYATIAGAVKNPGTYHFPVGSGYRDLIQLAGGTTLSESDLVFIDGGPMMGRIISNLNDTSTKATKGLLALPKSSNFIKKLNYPWPVILKQSRNNCEVCRMCTDLCPRYLMGHPLEPHKIMVSNIFARKSRPQLLKEAHLCVECGVCQNFSCPVDLAPMTVIQHMKELLHEENKTYVKGSGQSRVRIMRGWRKLPYQRLLQRLDLVKYAINEDLFYRVDDNRISTVNHLLQPPFGAKGKAVVKEGDVVKKGDLVIDRPEGKLGSKTHAAISGTVVVLTEHNLVIRRV